MEIKLLSGTALNNKLAFSNVIGKYVQLHYVILIESVLIRHHIDASHNLVTFAQKLKVMSLVNFTYPEI